MMLLAILPDWNSLDSVRLAHSNLEAAGLIFFALLVIAEALAHNSEAEKRKHLFDLIGIWFFAIAVLCEIAGYWYGQQNDALSDQKIRFLDVVAHDADSTAKGARTTADGAKTKADTARVEAAQAGSSAATALTTAGNARREAESFAREIAGAKQAAADAVSRLADAEQRLADSTQREAAAEAKLSAIKTPRSLIHADELVAALRPFSGTEYILNVFLDDESMRFTQAVAKALDAAGWVRKQPTTTIIGIPTMGIVLGHGAAENVPACVQTGISLHVHTKESLAVLQSTPSQSLPKTIQAALSLKAAIAPSISPPDERNVMAGFVDPTPPETVPMTICVGKKP